MDTATFDHTTASWLRCGLDSLGLPWQRPTAVVVKGTLKQLSPIVALKPAALTSRLPAVLGLVPWRQWW